MPLLSLKTKMNVLNIVVIELASTVRMWYAYWSYQKFQYIFMLKCLAYNIFRRKRKMLNPTRFSFHFMLPCRIIFIPSNCNYTCQNKKNISYVQLNDTENFWHIFHSLSIVLSTRLIKSFMHILAYSFDIIQRLIIMIYMA